MWSDPIVEETRRLRDEYSAKLNYNVHAIAEDLKDWERNGFPLAVDPNREFRPRVCRAIPHG
ncbi:hypothetical protein THSYN_25985 [Candidatus Thiodictyon syntrophicum]|jgi:hypothetical protein|uniref:Uncharacterized protein n=1 Tax=Candidatus Thiodictyon syntrophicum TaxID=1166950 RepID=A0A2K8UEN7_9GAMM|nr:hypothetical protein THSYN_25985 [Candidatus Thiodictyon syntrophicum]